VKWPRYKRTMDICAVDIGQESKDAKITWLVFSRVVSCIISVSDPCHFHTKDTLVIHSTLNPLFYVSDAFSICKFTSLSICLIHFSANPRSVKRRADFRARVRIASVSAGENERDFANAFEYSETVLA